MPERPSNWDRLRSIVTDALEQPPGDREAVIRHAAGDDPALVDEAIALVAAYDRSDGVIHPASDAWLGVGGVDLLSLGGSMVGRYRLERLISEGAMAAVYLARQTNPQRRVALKLVRHDLPLVDVSTRFLREAEALGRVQHPNVARIFEAGVHRPPGAALGGRGLPFIAMEFVDGPPITEYARRQRLDRDARIRLLIKVASAVHAAHQQAIIHRDLKPANVLVDTSGEPKVLDFGVARLIGAEDTVATLFQTTAGVLLGTPAYMSPEQATGRPQEVDVRSDVWALGVLLHELLTDRLPIEVGNTSIAGALRQIETTDPAPLGRFDKSLRGDLEVIAQTALAREKHRRYPSAQAMADDLQRVLDYQPIAARAPSTLYRVGRFARRHRFGLGAAVVFGLVLLAAGVLVSVALLRASRERDKAQAVNRFLQEIIAAVDPSTGDKNVAMLDALRSAERRITASLGGQPAVEADVRSAVGWMYFGLGRYDQAQAQLQRAIDRRRDAGDALSVSGLHDHARLAATLRWLYRPRDALAVAEAARADAERLFGRRHEVTLALREAIAGCYEDLEDLERAERDYRAILEDLRATQPESAPQRLAGMSNLAGVLMNRGKYAQAEELLTGLIDAYRRQGQERTLNLLTARCNRAVIAAETGRLPEAINEFRALADECAHALGDAHALTLRVLSNLATNLERSGDASAAADVYDDLLRRHVSAGGWQDGATLELCVGYASLMLRQKQFEPALDLLDRALAAAAQRPGGADEPVYQRLRLAQAGALAGLRRFDDAIPLYRATLGRLQSTLGHDHRDALIAANNFGLCLTEAGDGPAAVDVLEPALARALAAGFVSMEPVFRRNLGAALRRAGRLDDAERQLLRSHELSVARGEPVNAVKAATALADLYDARQQPAEAARWRAAASTSPAGN